MAVKYLRDTEMTIDDIACALGFSETANFRHAFRRWKRASPRDYRQALQDERLKAGGRRIGPARAAWTNGPGNRPLIAPPQAPSARAGQTQRRISRCARQKCEGFGAPGRISPLRGRSGPFGFDPDKAHPAGETGTASLSGINAVGEATSPRSTREDAAESGRKEVRVVRKTHQRDALGL